MIWHIKKQQGAHYKKMRGKKGGKWFLTHQVLNRKNEGGGKIWKVFQKTGP